MRRLIYTSIARKGLELSDCAAIIKGAVAQNAQRGITGVLLLADQTFLQYLEGPKENIEDTLSVIRRDRRHRQMTVLVDETQAQAKRLFGEWRMGFHHVAAVEPALGSGLLRNDELNPILTLETAAGDDLCVRLLGSFWRANARALEPLGAF